jgi:hypothetical protein
MNDKELIARLVAENYELRDKLKSSEESRDYWIHEFHKLKSTAIQAIPQTMDESVKAISEIHV